MTTIAAIATAPGQGAIGIVRLSGEQSRDLLAQVFKPHRGTFTEFRPWVLHRGHFLLEDQRFFDDVLCVYMPAPKTYTGEDMAEIQCHGSPLILETILARLFALGATPAERGEFSKRAFLNGRMDLSQAEAVAEIVSARSTRAIEASLSQLDGLLSREIASLRAAVDRLRAELVLAVDFPEEESDIFDRDRFAHDVSELDLGIERLLKGSRRSRIQHDGARVLLLGAVNAGKSSLLNAYLGRERALVTETPGTTRDYLEELCTLEGVPVRLVDTAGLRETCDCVERLGIARGLELASGADAALILLDGEALSSESHHGIPNDPRYREIFEATHDIPRILVWNKVDCYRPEGPPLWWREPFVCVSTRTGEGLDSLASLIVRAALRESPSQGDEYVAVNVRQAHVLTCAREELARLVTSLRRGDSCDLCCVQLNSISGLLGEIIGVSTPDAVLNSIFDSFCIGK
ncbi:MAG: tRNA uridine-5-carboxymethylaminomethyl(34) synthesis GTPase MnmE [Desulfovibrionaceae bacterium]|nr:tRNA uridine-5-carboxymethylaminomethyl(34) synthesis GTPase MnmE [Desulfovibrionaceae bacterium]